MGRLLREVRSALHRRKREGIQARRAVEQQVRSEVCESRTAMLLSCELAMAVPEVPAPAAEKIRLIDNLARDMLLRLGHELTRSPREMIAQHCIADFQPAWG